jgi:tryptophanyl-tRNA synthetase
LANPYNNKSAPSLSYVGAIKQYNKDIKRAGEIQNQLSTEGLKKIYKKSHISKLEEELKDIQSRKENYLDRREHFYGTFRKAFWSPVAVIA